MFNVMEANTKESQEVRLWRVCRGQRTWHEEKEILGTWEESCGSSHRAGRLNQPNKKVQPEIYRTSDQLIVLRGRESRLQGEGVDRNMQSLKETLTGRARPEQLVQTSLEGIARKAKREKKYRFRDLYRQLNYGALKLAWEKLNKKAAPGVDKVTAQEFSRNLEENLNKILESLKGKRYHAKLVRRKYIDKGNGKKRPLGIPALSDKIVQRATADILEAIFEQDFIEESYGYRPNKSAKTAVIDLSEELQFGKYNYIVEADIKGFFDNIDHDWLIKMLEQRINDKQFIRLIKKWLKAGILEETGEVIHPVTGTPQGGIVSPILANIYLHYALDIWFKRVVGKQSKGEACIYRYADDCALYHTLLLAG